jgi:serine/threonine protein kinase
VVRSTDESGPADPTISAEGSEPAGPVKVVQKGAAATVLGDGELVAGRYRVVKLLARGGMGEVYQAEDQELHESVALKIIRSEIANDQRTIKRFRREVQLARKVTHRNVCRCFDVGHHRAEGKPQVSFITMELLAGETLSDRIRRGPIPCDEALTIVRQLTAGLEAAHAAGIVHRDFKSDNVILVGKGAELRAVVTDFGVARALAGPARRGSSLTAAGMKVGTPAYMAPEQVEGLPPTERADLYALGVVMYEMVTGTLPFQAETRFATAMKRLSEPPTPPRQHRADLDARWEQVILRCLERAPDARFACAGQVIAALEGKEAPPSPPARRPIVWAIVIALAVAAATAAVMRAFM